MTIKAFSAITVKGMDEDQRTITGVASTPALDRVKDSIDPMGLRFAKEVPLLLDHKHDQPVGTVTFGKASPAGLPFTAKVAKVDEDGVIKQRTDAAWHSVKAGLIKAVSVGFRPDSYEPNEHGGLNFKSAEVHELSLVALPCNPQAVIQAFKSLQHAEADAQAAGEVPGVKPESNTDAASAADAAQGADATAQSTERFSLLPFLV